MDDNNINNLSKLKEIMKNHILFYATLLFFNLTSFSLQEIEQDFDFIYGCLKENHPGYHDSLNPTFREVLENMYECTKSKIQLCENEDEKIKIIKEFLKQFNCSHLRVHYYNPSCGEVKNNKGKYSWSFEEIKKDVYLITLPTFDQSILDLDSRDKVLEELAKTVNFSEKTYIFDVRNNGGGNSMLAQSVLEALYGKTKVQYCIELTDKDVFVEWRASKQNIENIENFYKKGTENNYLDDATKKILEELMVGMKKAHKKDLIFYKTSPGHNITFPTPNAGNKDNNNDFAKKIIVIINGGCGSATLNFLDLITTLEPNTILMGQETGSDSLYMDVGRIELPSKKGALIYPMKVYRTRKRGNNETYKPHIFF